MKSNEMNALKKERVEFRTSVDVKRSIEEAAELTGKTVSSFICDFVTEKATEVINEHRRLIVHQGQWEDLMSQLERPSSPNELMDEIMRLSLEEDKNWTVTMKRSL
ncbi:hypothetical protein VH1709_contig00054-0001 [Vibrio harveyi]|uniref:type II toxin-antitoxin system TacA family antitoxin n=1 Tax=Vibrio harveyi TaxID=669 RepID=UPI000D78652E|nr:DUF1778 domain-containing protein [Vibrio harveyi]GBL01046.1 hypothetical protein VH1709_contig00054-0001 [Vibrio harveyi]